MLKSDAKYGNKQTGRALTALQIAGIFFLLGAVALVIPFVFYYGPQQGVPLPGTRALLGATDNTAHPLFTPPFTNNISKQQSFNDAVNQSIKDLKSIFDEEKTDKGYNHGYYRTYGRFFFPYREYAVRFLEIGVKEGKSMQAWERFFPNHEHIYGIGYGMGFAKQDKKKEVEGKKVTLYNGDQSDVEFLRYVCYDAGEAFDIIVDDGSHVPDHQQISLENLIDCLKPGGIYVVEDMFTSYYNKPGAMVYNYKLNQTGLYQPGSFVERVKKLVDVINREQHLHLDMSFFKNDHKISSITFEQNLVVFRKIDQWDIPFQDRVPGFVLRGTKP